MDTFVSLFRNSASGVMTHVMDLSRYRVQIWVQQSFIDCLMLSMILRWRCYVRPSRSRLARSIAK
jgi:hypothetical protein